MIQSDKRIPTIREDNIQDVNDDEDLIRLGPFVTVTMRVRAPIVPQAMTYAHADPPDETKGALMRFPTLADVGI